MNSPLTRPKIIIIVSLVIFLGIAALFVILRFRPSTTSSINTNLTSPTPTVTLVKDYTLDTDGDKLPDFIEAQLGLNPTKNEVEGCLNNKCNDPTFQQAYVPKHNIVIILDSSGSMSLKTGTAIKMDAAKQAITTFVKSTEDQAQIGLVVYGHLGSNSTKDKTLSCASADTLAPIGSLTNANITATLANIKPTGWTPIGLALTKAQEMFTGKEKDTNEVFVVTDGAETCGTDPTTVASALAASPAHVKVNVIGFAVTPEETAGLQAISTAGKGSFDTAESSREIEDIFSRNKQNWSTLLNANDCIDSVINQLAVCTVDLHTKIDNFRTSYTSPTAKVISREDRNANENVYYTYTTYLQNFQSQKSAELNKMKNGFVNKL